MTTEQEIREQKDLKGSEVQWKSYVEYTASLTESSRKLAYASVAICWILKGEAYPKLIFFALLFNALFFFFDILQYFIAALSLRVWLRTKEKQYHKLYNSLKGEYTLPSQLDIAPFTFWIFKISSLCISYIVIIIQVVKLFFK